MRLRNLTGLRFGRLTVIGRAGNGRSGQVRWVCRCSCGNKVIAYANDLVQGKTQSCGCYNREKVSNLKTHGLSEDRLYAVWRGMKRRCLCETNERYKDYGGRGITICDEWINDFQAFYDWAISKGYNPEAKQGECTVDRINNDGNYSPENCRLVSMKVQSLNSRRNRRIFYNGENLTVKEWSTKLNIPYRTLLARLTTLNWSTEKALTQKIGVN